MDWGIDDLPFDPDYPIGPDGDGLDPLTQRELDRIKRQAEKDAEYDSDLDLPM